MAGERRAGVSANRLLNGWKEIAAFFSKDERTVRRWAAAMDLPVHRVPGAKRAAVYAYAHDLERWLTKHREESNELFGTGEAGPPLETFDKTSAGGIVAGLPPDPARARRRPPGPVAAVGAFLLAGAVLAGGWYAAHPGEGRTSSSSAPHAQPYQPDADAEQLFLDGQYNLSTRRADGLRRAAALFTEATIIDPNYAEAYAGLADAYNLLSQYTVMPAADAYPKALAAARRALRLDPDSSRAYAALAFNAFYWKRDLKASMEMFAKALEIDPNNASANAWYALIVMQDRQFGTALSAIARAEKLLPQAPEIKANKALILFHSGHAEEALAILLPLAETQPNMLSPHAYLATILLDTGRYQDFIREYRLAAEIEENGARLAIADTGERGLKAGGGQGMLEAMYAEQLSQFARGKEPAFKLALTATMLGQRERALEYLEQSVRRGEADRFGLMLEPALKPLWTEPRFQQLARQLKLTS